MSRPVLPESAYEALGLSPDAIKDLMNPKPTNEPTKIAAPNLLQSDEDNARPMSPNETAITLYAELLLHIRTVTLFASLRTNYSHETQAKLSADGSNITVSHEGQSATIRLPINVKGDGDAALSLPSQPPSKELTLRLQMEEREGSNLLGTMQDEGRQANIVPWGGGSLSQVQELDITCKGCGAVIVPRGMIRHWRDLPSENWAEMMDFWHCHKPDEHHLHGHTHEEAVHQKGYAAGNRLEALEGVGYVDLTSFLLKRQDCEGAQLTSGNCAPKDSLICKVCDHNLGSQDDASNGWRIRKWCVGVATSDSSPPTTYATQKWIVARLLYLIENSGVRKFHVHSLTPTAASSSDLPTTLEPQSSVPSLLIWVFSPDLLFSSSIHSPNRHDPTRSMKVFYQKQTWQPLRPGDPESATVEDVEFPPDLFEEMGKVLEQSQGLLPPTARSFQGWNVGLLERFDGADVSKVEDRSGDVENYGSGDE
ncbi:Nn.00g055170.m01.CDS01 [Neocucurbitaria sp. VM-36]